MQPDEPLVLALPKGRILKEVMPLIRAAGIEPEPAFDDDDERRLRFATNVPGLHIIRVRAFDVATFVAFGGAHLGVAGNDVLMEFAYDDLYAPLDLDIGHCRLSLAEPDPAGPLGHMVTDAAGDTPHNVGHIRVATKYPNITRAHFARHGIQAECVKLSGAMELAPALGLSRRIVDLVSSGSTLKANHLREVAVIANVTSRLIVNRAAFKTRPNTVGAWVNRFREVAAHAA
ncbi:ATP phosphoribosyltransferase [Rhodothalassium salexigens]|uniref:ATP phosphoribosyltransferase n=1 Tax=Rhodothalassium salexigens TaxID=1086 RepID=UPI001912139E|nr:ATP phosphoribosyltransferase [Rhodothalassium salexigens]MBK5921862.1 ATP phosphoribosyltransferase [Rhodothalassium salexigens]